MAQLRSSARLRQSLTTRTSAPHARSWISPDSPLEGDGFEPSVPYKKQPFLAVPVRFRNSPSATKTGPFGDRWLESISLQRRGQQRTVPALVPIARRGAGETIRAAPT